MAYTYKVIPANAENLAKMATAKSVLPLVNLEWRTQNLIKIAAENIHFGFCNFGIENFWMLNLLENEVATFNLVAFSGVETYTAAEINEIFVTPYDCATQ